MQLPVNQTLIPIIEVFLSKFAFTSVEGMY
jgi:hypothetical protein